MCRSVDDAALMLAAMSEHPLAAQFDLAARNSVADVRVGVLRLDGDVCDAPVAPEVQAVFDAALDVLRGLVAEVREAELPMPDLGALIDVEGFAYHERLLAAHADRYDPRTRDGLLPGPVVTKIELERMRRALADHRASIQQAFARVDLVVLPTLPVLPMRIAECTDPFALPSCTFAFSLGGLPCISVPCGFSRSGLPIGMLIGGPPLADPRVLALARAFERATKWHLLRPVPAQLRRARAGRLRRRGERCGRRRER
jgi:aspartyl-tRNA(Asn)/glutamyl-tRNA(Gln) amidotransferase subunit A